MALSVMRRPTQDFSCDSFTQLRVRSSCSAVLELQLGHPIGNFFALFAGRRVTAGEAGKSQRPERDRNPTERGVH
jgi:hypothetical protein